MTDEPTKWIPLHVVDALILKLQKEKDEFGMTKPSTETWEDYNKGIYWFDLQLKLLTEIKKEAISIPEGNKTLEQRIRDRIKELKKHLKPNGLMTMDLHLTDKICELEDILDLHKND